MGALHPPATGDIAPGRLPAEAYAANFADAHPPLSSAEAVIEADRCLFCYDAPCIAACPTGIDVPSFIRKIGAGNPKGAARDILSANIMGGACARVCPTEILCEGACVRHDLDHEPVKIGALQRHAVDWAVAGQVSFFSRAPATGNRIAVVGGGPAGIACAHGLAREGHDVTIFEARDKLGGLNEYGIAAYKVPEDFAQAELDYILGIGGIEARTGWRLGRDGTLESLGQDFDAVFLGLGLGAVKALWLAGEDLPGIADAAPWIEALRQSPDLAAIPIGRRVVVIGGGNTAIDAAVQAKRLGAEEVTLAYRRGPEAMSATPVEQDWAKRNGVALRHWLKPSAVLGEAGRLRAIRFERTRPGPSGALEGSGDFVEIPADMALKAIGQASEPVPLGSVPELKSGRIAVDGEGRTSLAGIWAGGDCVFGGPDLTVAAVADGKRAAQSIHAFLTARP